MEDEPNDAELDMRELQRAGYNPVWKRVETELDFLAELDQGWEIILADYNLPSFDGLRALELLTTRKLDIPFILVSGAIDCDKAVTVMKAGANDYIMKDDLGRLAPTVEREMRDAAERREHLLANQALRESEERFRVLVEDSPDGIGIYQSGSLVFINSSGARQLGASTKEELLGLKAEKIIHPEDFPYTMELLKRRMAGETSVHPAEVRYVRVDGTILSVEVTVTPMTFDGNPAVQFVARDITERNRREKEMRDSRELYCSLVETLPQAVFRKDREGHFVFCNQRFCDDLSRSNEEILGKTDADFFEPRIAAAYRQDDLRVIDSGSPVDQVEEYKGPDGKTKFVHTVKTPLRDSSGNTIGIQGIFWDVTELKLMAQAHAQLAKAVDQTAEAIIITDVHGHIQYANPAFETITGYSREEVIGKNPRILKSGRHDAEFYRKMWETISAGNVWTGDMFNKRKNGTLYEENVTISPMRDAAGQIVNYVAVKRDITERKNLEAQLMRNQRIESIGLLAGGIAHDLNNVLAPILMSVELLEMKFSEEGTQKTLSTIGASAQRGAELIKQVLAFSKGTQGGRTTLQLRHVIREIQGIVRQTFPKSIELQIDLPKDLWTVDGDATQLHQVLMNLCVNARDAMPSGGRITITAENQIVDQTFAQMNPEAKAQPYVILIVADTGTGIPPEVRDRVFDPFFSTKEPGKGTGLGLYTVMTVVRGHGGFLNVYSEVGRGTRFKVYLPATISPELEAKAAERTGMLRGHGELVLLVDDEAAIRIVGEQILTALGYRVLTAEDGAEAVALGIQQITDLKLLITDMMMPIMDGAATIRALRRLAPGLKVIAMSGLDSTDQERDPSKTGANAFLSKPFTAETLARTAHQLLM